MRDFLFLVVQNTFKRQIVKTNDGSSSIYIPEMEEHYHSVHGALQEAEHVFIENGLKQIEKDEVCILEVGYGTGLNAVLTAERSDNTINYVGLEAYPVLPEMAFQMSYANLNTQAFEKMHEGAWEEWISINDRFHLKKIESRLEEVVFEEQFDLVYYDAFGPRAQSEMWKPELFQKVVAAMNEGGILVTYCAKGQVRRDLQSCGLKMERLPGPPGKREMLRGTKC